MFTGSHEPDLYGDGSFSQAQLLQPATYCDPVSLT